MEQPTSWSRWRSLRWRRSSRNSSHLLSNDWSVRMRLIVVRHGATLHNAEARFTGQTDAPLSDHGVTQARAVAGRLRTIDFSMVVSSDLLRATQTAEEIIAAHPSASLSLDPDL